jgi:hypothetical protein
MAAEESPPPSPLPVGGAGPDCASTPLQMLTGFHVLACALSFFMDRADSQTGNIKQEIPQSVSHDSKI